MQGFLNLNKPYSFTSHDCVAKVRRLLKLKRVGHGGTLDPMATGVLPIAFGKATRLLQYLRQDKAYQATIRFGVTTTTDDLEGEVIETKSASGLTQEAVEAALKQFLGKITQIPPQYSAIQVQGQRLYDLARKGEVVEVPSRVVEVSQIDVFGWKPGEIAEVEVAIACGGGTYIRAIARDLGNHLGTGGTLAALTRTASCGLSLSDSLTLEDLEMRLQAGTFAPISPTAALDHLSAIVLSPTDAKAWCQGKRLPYPYPHDANPLQIHNEDGHFLGIGQLTDTPDPLLIPQMVYEPA